MVVPIDQETASLESGYYTIDGTRKNKSEGKFTIAKDIFMGELLHLGLNGASKKKRPIKKKPVKKRPIKKKTATKSKLMLFNK